MNKYHDLREASLVLQRHSFKSQFGPTVYQRGVILAHSASVGDLDISVTLKPTGQFFTIRAMVGSQSNARKSYRVQVSFSAGKALNLACTCTCPFSVHCKHAVAVLKQLLNTEKLLLDSAKLIDADIAPIAVDNTAHSLSSTDPKTVRALLEAQAAASGFTLAQLGFNVEEQMHAANARANVAPPTINAHAASARQAELAAAQKLRDAAASAALEDDNNFNQWAQWFSAFDRTPSIKPYEQAAGYGAKPITNIAFVLSFAKVLTVRPMQVLLTYQGTSRASTRAQPLPNLVRISNFNFRDLWAQYPPKFRPVLQLLFSNPSSDIYQNTSYQLIGELGERTLEALFAHGVYLEKFGTQALRLGQPRTIAMRWLPDAEGRLKISAAVQPSATLFNLADMWYFDTAMGEIGRAPGISGEQHQLMQTLPPLRLANVNRAAEGMLTRTGLSEMPLPVQLSRRVINTRPKPVLLLERVPLVPSSKEAAAGVTMLGGRLVFDYEDVRAPDLRAKNYHTTQASAVIEVQRAQEFEDEIRMRLRTLGLERLADGHNVHPYFSAIQKSHWLRAVDTHYRYAFEDWFPLIAPLESAGIRVEIDPQLPLELLDAPQDWFADLDDTGDSDWFNFALGIVINGERVSLLPILVQALASNRLSLQPEPGEAPDAVWLAALDERRRIPLPLAKIRTLIAPIVEWLEGLKGETLRLPALRAAVFNELSEGEISIRCSQALSKLAKITSGALDHKRCKVPKTLKATLRGYQHDGLDWLSFLGEHGLGGVLADDMGLGKTIQVLAHILAERAAKRLTGPVLIVMPTSLIPNWCSEAKRFAPVLKVLTLHGPDRAAKFSEIAVHDVVLTTYALLFRDEDALAEPKFSLAVFDEAQAIKNPQAKAALAARRIRADRRIVMSGTPLENHLGELWAQVDLVLPGLLGPQKAFATRFRTPIEKFGDDARSKILEKRLKPFLLRRTKSEVASDLPAKTEITRPVALEGGQRELYETLRLAMNKKVRDAVAARGIKQSSIVVLDALLKLRQACCDPALVKLPSARKVKGSAKREMLLEMLAELIEEGRRVLVFSQFTEMLDLIEADLGAQKIPYLRLDGSTIDRATPVQRFQALEVPVFLISLKAGGVGLNLTAADTVIHYDPWWNPAVENQATDRAHRIGQDKPVFVYKLVCSNTIEEKIVALQAKKAALASAIMSGGSSTALKWDAEAIAHLFGADE